MDLTIVIPMRDEAEAFPALAAALEDLWERFLPDRAFEAVLVDDGSTDATRDLATSWAEGTTIPAKILGLNPGEGIGRAIAAGFDAAAGELVATADADLAYPLPTLLLMMDRIEEGYDLVTASPYVSGGHVEGVSGKRLWPSKIANGLHRLRFGRGASPHTFTCGFRVYRRRLWPTIRPQAPGFLATTELMVRALRAGAKVAEIPSVLGPRQAGASKMKVLRTTLSHLAFAVRGPRS